MKSGKRIDKAAGTVRPSSLGVAFRFLLMCGIRANTWRHLAECQTVLLTRAIRAEQRGRGSSDATLRTMSLAILLAFEDDPQLDELTSGSPRNGAA